MKPKRIKTREEVRQQFCRVGKSVAAWARKHNVDEATTYQVLSGAKKGVRGEAHRIAVLLGIKDGVA
jgi:gp16 family phage-associated protein